MAESGILALIPSMAFCMIVAAELYRPRRPLMGHRGQRWVGNISLYAGNAAIVLWLAPMLAASAASLPANRFLAWFTGLLFLDLLSYFGHRLFHAVPLLWRLHAVHHTDLDVDVTTAVRHHPLEFATIYAATAILAGLIDISAIIVAAYGAIALVVQMIQHCNVAIPEVIDRRLRALLVTPAFHRTHHSRTRDDADANFGTVLSLWDRAFGSARAAPCDGEPALFGVAALSAPHYQRLHWMLITPLC